MSCLGDFNLPGIDWNTHKSPPDPIQLSFLEFFYSSGLVQLNFLPTRNNAILDFFFTTETNLISDISTLPPIGARDHDMLSFNIQLSPHNLPQYPSTPIRNYKKCNYDQLKHDLSLLDWNSIFSSCTCSAEYWSAFILTINDLLDIHCPTFIPPDPNKRKPFYYPPSIIRLQACKRKLWKKTRSSACESSRADYRAANNAYRDAVDAFHSTKESTNVLNSRESSDFYKFIRHKLNRSSSILPLIHPANHTPITDPVDKATLFNEYFCSVFTADDGVTPDFPNRLSPSTTPIDSVFFTHGSVLTKLQKLKKSQSASPDSFPSVVLRNCAHQLATPLSIVYNVIFDLSVLPPDWQKSIVIPLHKKGPHNNPSNYRPISLTSTCCKVMESIIHDFISNFLLSNNLLSKHQHGFIKNRSTLTCLLSSLKNWLSSLDLAKSTDAIYIDFAKAFDTVTHEKLLHKLTSYGIRGKLHGWISAWLSNRTQSVCIEGLLSPPKSVLSGVLQGSVLGPLLFLLFINDLIDTIPPEAHPTLYAFT